MGSHDAITAASFPRQGDRLGRRVAVRFHHDTSVTLTGTLVRDDDEDPYVGIIRLDDGRHVLRTECQHSFDNPAGRRAPRIGTAGDRP